MIKFKYSRKIFLIFPNRVQTIEFLKTKIAQLTAIRAENAGQLDKIRSLENQIIVI